MAIIMPKAIFFHVPKTGGGWVRQALKNSTEVIVECTRHPVPRDFTFFKAFTFCFVRHPLTWYRSYFAYKTRVGWRNERGFDDLRSDSFDIFIRNVLKDDGALAKMYNRRIGHRMDFIGKYENLVEDLIKALNLAKQPFDEALLRNTPPSNVSPEVPIYNLTLAEKLLVKEYAVIKRFNYSSDIKTILKGEYYGK